MLRWENEKELENVVSLFDEEFVVEDMFHNDLIQVMTGIGPVILPYLRNYVVNIHASPNGRTFARNAVSEIGNK